jgi:hypothetical protein
MILRSPAEDENGETVNVQRGFGHRAASVMPAWIAGIQARRMRPDTSLSTWVPAVRVGTTIFYCNVYATYVRLMANPPPDQIFEGGTKDTKNFGFSPVQTL